MLSLLLACVAGPLYTGQEILTYLFFNILPIFIIILHHLAYPTKTLAMAITKSAPWHLWGKPRTIQCTRIKRYKIPVRNHQAKNKTSGATIQTYLFLALFAAYKVGCCINVFLQCFSGPSTWTHSHLAFQSKATLQPTSPPVRFNSDSYPIGVNSHASKCMANKAHLFEDLRLNKDKRQVDGISDGLEIAGEGTFKFNIKDNEDKQHTIKIKNSLYVPKMRRCLLSPQHWVQEMGDEQTWMELKRQWPYDCVLNWNGGKKTVPHKSSTNVPLFYTASSLTCFRAFTATFETMEASSFQREKAPSISWLPRPDG
jgi:hypothetical protein